MVVKFCSEGGGVRSPQRKALWREVECFRGVSAEVKLREHTSYVQKGIRCFVIRRE